MKNQWQEYMDLVKGFMKKHYLLFLSLKVLKFLVIFFLFSCESKPVPSNINTPDTVMVDSINSSPEDGVIFRNEEVEEKEEGAELLSPQEG